MYTSRPSLIYLAITLLAITINSQVFRLGLWKHYQFNTKELTFTYSLDSTYKVQFKNRLSAETLVNYHYAQTGSVWQDISQGSNLTVLTKHKSLAISNIKVGEQIELSSSLLNSNSQFQIKYSLNGEQVTISTNNQQIILLVASFDTIIFRQKNTKFADNFNFQAETIKNQSLTYIYTFMKYHNIPIQHLSFTKNMISQTFLQICQEQHSGSRYFGLCYNIHEGKRHPARYQIDIRYSFLIIDQLFQVYPLTAFYLFEQMVSLLEDKLFYSDGHFVQIPEHISIVRNVVNNLKRWNSLQNSSKTIPKFAIKVKALLNGFMNQMLLSDVNNLEQQINYRQNKKMHPTLLRMLSLKWKSNSLKNTISSIYQQSFTPDYFYNSANQKIDTCVSKTAWLTSAAVEYINFIKKLGGIDDKQALEQPSSLYRIFQHVASSDNNAKQAEGVRIYASQIGYESLLPFVYDLSGIFPEEMMKNITTPFGLASLNLDHQKFNSHFEFRGNIHLYFNYKILFEAKRKAQVINNKRMLPIILQLIDQIKTFILKNQQQGSSYTMWTTNGTGLRNRKDLSLLNALFLSSK